MNTTAKDIVKNFYESDFITNPNLMKDFFHPEVSLIWNNSEGLSIMNYDELGKFFEEIRRTYSELKIEISHLISCKNQVTVRYFASRMLEDQEEEIGIAHFMAIWEVKDGKIHKGYQISQPASKTDEITNTYHLV